MKKTFLRIVLLMLALSVCFVSAACGKAPENSEAASDTDTTSVEDDTPTTESSEASDPKAHLLVNTKWNFGYVGSYQNKQATNAVLNEAENYSYTDVFTIPKAGTTVTFCITQENTDGKVEIPSSDVYVISQWKQDNGEWILMRNGANYIGEDTASPILTYAENNTLIYSYTTSSDNENLRVCYRSGQTQSFTPESFPKIYAEYTGKEGTETPTVDLDNLDRLITTEDIEANRDIFIWEWDKCR